MPGPLAAVLGAAGKAVLGSVASGLGSSISNKLFGGGEQRQEEGLDLKRLVRTALAAGFNPSTVLNATGGAGFRSQVSSEDLSWGRAIGGGIVQGLGDGLADHFLNQQERELTDAKIDLARAQAASIRAETAAGPSLSSVLDVRNGGIAAPADAERPVGHTAYNQPLSLGVAADESLEARGREEGMKGAYSLWGLPSWLPTTQHVSDLHGDGIGLVYGAGTLPVAAGTAAYRWRRGSMTEAERAADDAWDGKSEPIVGDWVREKLGSGGKPAGPSSIPFTLDPGFNDPLAADTEFRPLTMGF